MPLGYDFYPEHRLLFIRGQGVITQPERIRAMLSWLSDPQYEECSDALIDFAGTQSTPKVRELRELIALLSQHIPADGPRRVAMVTSRPITFTVARVFERLVQLQDLPFEVKVFMSLEGAWKWLRPFELPFQPH
jgi:hypothetical protein